MFKRKFNITRIKKALREELQDIVLVESPIDLIVNSEPLVNIICLPKDLEELVTGFLFSIGVINSSEDIKVIKIEQLDNKIYIDLKDSIEFNIDNLKVNPVSRIIDSTCGISSPWRKIIEKALNDAKESLRPKFNKKINSEIIFSCVKQMQNNTPLYRETGGCHGAAIFDFSGILLSVKEDIGRHNAIDKVIGELLLKNIEINDKILVSTGRLTGDSVLKAIRAEIPIVASLSAAIESSIRLSFAYGITLIGFVRGARMNIYTHPERIKIS